MNGRGEIRYEVLVDQVCCEGVILSRGQLFHPVVLKCGVYRLIRVGAVRQVGVLAAQLASGNGAYERKVS